MPVPLPLSGVETETDTAAGLAWHELHRPALDLLALATLSPRTMVVPQPAQTATPHRRSRAPSLDVARGVRILETYAREIRMASSSCGVLLASPA